MHSYKNSNRDSGVVAYEPGDNNIAIQFRDGSIYLYTHQSAGPMAVKQMKLLAAKGKGLTTFINQHVKDRYEAKSNNVVDNLHKKS